MNAIDRVTRAAGAVIGLFLIGGCSWLGLTGSADEAIAIAPPRFETPSGREPPITALVLSGGAVRAFAHIGVLRVLAAEGLRPDLIVGTSAGAIVGAFYAAGKPLDEIERAASRIDWALLADVDARRMLFGARVFGFAKGERLESFLREALPAPIERMPTPFAAVATTLATGEPVVLNHGDTARALRASAAVPGFFEPVEVAGTLLTDGQIVSPLPVDVARALGACVVIAVDVVYPPKNSVVRGPLSVLFQTLSIATYHHLMRERGNADVLLTPAIRAAESLSFDDRAYLIGVGTEAAHAALVELRHAFGPGARQRCRARAEPPVTMRPGRGPRR